MSYSLVITPCCRALLIAKVRQSLLPSIVIPADDYAGARTRAGICWVVNR